MGDSKSTEKCGCGISNASSTLQKKQERGCVDKSSFGKDINKDKSEGGKCDSSQEQFKQKIKDKCQKVWDKLSQKNKCHSSHETFIKNNTDVYSSPCGNLDASANKNCHDSQQKFLEGITSSGNNSLGCNEIVSEQKYRQCPKPTADATLSSETSGCLSHENIKKDSICFKISGYCKNLAKEYVKLKPRSECSKTLDVAASSNKCNKTSTLPSSGPPRVPEAETGASVRDKAHFCSFKSTCPELNKPIFSDFFPIDVRNKKLNECIERYMKIDPTQVISKCSQFANKTVDMSEKCLGSVMRSQQKYLQSRKGLSLVPGTRTRQLVVRWAPSAAVYLATTAVFMVYVTEWKAVLKHVPSYSYLNQTDNTNLN